MFSLLVTSCSQSEITNHNSKIDNARCRTLAVTARLCLVAVLTVCAAARAGEKCWWPEDKPAATAQAPARPRGASGWFMSFYRDTLSQVDGIRTCRFEPTCGGYARQAIGKHGPLLGWIMGCERAVRYHGDTTTYRRAVLDGHLRLLDPVSDTDWWFRHPFRRKQP